LLTQGVERPSNATGNILWFVGGGGVRIFIGWIDGMGWSKEWFGRVSRRPPCG
jgi:hypothetical protein